MHFRTFLRMSLQHYFGFPNIIPEGGLLTPMTPLDPPLQVIGKYISISIATGSGHPDYLGHLGHFFSRSK